VRHQREIAVAKNPAALFVDSDSGSDDDESEFTSGGCSNWSEDSEKEGNDPEKSDSDSEKIPAPKKEDQYHAPVPFKQTGENGNDTTQVLLPVSDFTLI
jgi:hypothetical protein